MSEQYHAGFNSARPSLYQQVISILHTVLYDIRRYFWLLVLCILIPVGLLLFKNYRDSKVYKATFTVTYEELVRKIYGDRLNKLNTMLRESPGQAAAVLGVSQQTVKAFKGVKAENIIGEDLAKDMSVEKIPFIIHAFVSDTTAVPAIQKGVVRFLEESNTYLAEKKELRMQEMENELSFINNQLSLLDTLKRKYNNNSSLSKADKNSEDFGSIYQLSYDLYKRKMELEKKISQPENIYVIDDALVPVPNSRSYIKVGIIGLIAGFVFYLLIVYLLIPAIKLKD